MLCNSQTLEKRIRLGRRARHWEGGMHALALELSTLWMNFDNSSRRCLVLSFLYFIGGHATRKVRC